MLFSGVYLYLPLGLKVLRKIEDIVRQEMDSCGAQELLLSCLQSAELWKKTGRDKEMGPTMFRFKDRKGRSLCLGPTHEEVITELIKNYINSYKQLPLTVYQIQTKFRDEIRPRFGVIRSCEFIMKDAYSFDSNLEGLNNSYRTMYESYNRIFKRCGLSFASVQADPGVMGGNLSHEFMAFANAGEDKILYCRQCNFTRAFKEERKASQICPNCSSNLEVKFVVEVGHIFQLGTKYSLVQKAFFKDTDGKDKPFAMGCYGIGITRLIAAIIEQNHDSNGIVWPREVAPYEILILPLNMEQSAILEAALDIYRKLKALGTSVLLDDRNLSAGVKLKDADLIGIPLRITIGQEKFKKGKLEIKLRGSQQVLVVNKESLFKELERLKWI
jgi:prolyl-tRNA synthetase